MGKLLLSRGRTRLHAIRGIWFHFSEGRSRRPGGLHGIAQTDGYAAYKTLFAEMNKAAQPRSHAAG